MEVPLPRLACDINNYQKIKLRNSREVNNMNIQQVSV